MRMPLSVVVSARVEQLTELVVGGQVLVEQQQRSRQPVVATEQA